MRRRHLLGTVGAGSLALLSAPLSRPAWAQAQVDLHAPSGPSIRPMTMAYPQKGPMILQRTSPPRLEIPFEVFDKGVFTPNDQHYVSWHWATFPSEIDVGVHRVSSSVRAHRCCIGRGGYFIWWWCLAVQHCRRTSEYDESGASLARRFKR